MGTASQGSRENKALQVLALVNQGMTVRAACKQIGYSRSAFYQFQLDRPEFIQDLQQKMVSTSEEVLLGILLTRVRLLEQIIKDSLKDETNPRDRLAIYKMMETQLDNLANNLRLSGANHAAASEALGGPILTPGTSRFSISDTD